MRALITGVNGFVGKHLAKRLLVQGVEVWGTTRESSPSLILLDSNIKIYKTALEVSDNIYTMLLSVKPDIIFHLAGQSNVRKSWDNKEGTFYTNVNKTIFLLEACLSYQKLNPELRVITVGSSEEYGKVDLDSIPIKEETPLNPMSPYGASKAAVSFLAKQYYDAYGLNVLHVRPFNHIGPGQSLGFVVPDFTKQIVDIEMGKSLPEIKVGNLSAARDFIDVRDIVSYYVELAINKNVKFGQIVNVCSGKVCKIQEVLNSLLKLSSREINIVIDPSKIRPVDVPIYYGDNNKLKTLTTYETQFNLEQSLYDIINSIRWNENVK
jgi:GDP-4-dehydro-6-deoxy-D-mannose reductase